MILYTYYTQVLFRICPMCEYMIRLSNILPFYESFITLLDPVKKHKPILSRFGGKNIVTVVLVHQTSDHLIEKYNVQNKYLYIILSGLYMTDDGVWV